MGIILAMNKPLEALLSRLSYGSRESLGIGKGTNGFVETLARGYEKARNAIEYRADNLVRRAAIERILKRTFVLSRDPKFLSENLLKELKWAKYLSIEETKRAQDANLEEVLSEYTSFLSGTVPQEWVVKIASAHIDELIDLNTDYKEFTLFAFQVLKQKIKLNDENLDLLIYFAVDKIYSGSDDEKIAYHLLKLAGKSVTPEIFAEAWKLFNLAKNHKGLSRITKFVRRQMPPLVLFRDIYFYDPESFKESLVDEEVFMSKAKEVLEVQLHQTSDKIKTAGSRSVLYVFLTKMILAFGLEVPFELLVFKDLRVLSLVINLVFPPLFMWIMVSQMRLPGKREEEALVERTWYILKNFDDLENEEDVLVEESEEKNLGFLYWVFSTLYIVFFVGVFAAIFFVLGKIGYTLFSKLIFIFFLTIIAFFAYRVSQISKLYSWKGVSRERTSSISVLALPILTIGSYLSMGLAKLNFLAFVFDFLLEAPFKLILGFVDDWVKFIAVKKESQVID